MQNNRLLQVRHRYLKARRDFEMEQLKHQEALKEAQKVFVKTEPEPAVIEPDNIATCSICSRTFIDKRGLSSHKRFGSCVN